MFFFEIHAVAAKPIQQFFDFQIGQATDAILIGSDGEPLPREAGQFDDRLGFPVLARSFQQALDVFRLPYRVPHRQGVDTPRFAAVEVFEDIAFRLNIDRLPLLGWPFEHCELQG